MCKIFAMSDMSKVPVTPKLLRSIRNAVCALSDKDGFGYATLNLDHTIGGERTMRPMMFNPLIDNAENPVLKLPIVLKTSDRFGQVETRSKALIAHGRFSTNEKLLANTHPFTSPKTALIHNGVVYDETGFVDDELKTCCDTEILLKYWERGGMEAIEQNVTGYYALAILDREGKLHIVRDSRAMLYMAWNRTVGSFMFATTIDILKSVCKAMKWKMDEAQELLPNHYVVMQGNEIVSHREIKPLVSSYTAGLDSKASLAFGAGDYQASDFNLPDVEPSYRERQTGRLACDDAPEAKADTGDDCETMDVYEMMEQYGSKKKIS
jgi:predicted glutamine amidotransferase